MRGEKQAEVEGGQLWERLQRKRVDGDGDGGSLEVKCEESEFSLLALEALATHIWQVFCIHTIPPEVSLGQARKGAEWRGLRWVYGNGERP